MDDKRLHIRLMKRIQYPTQKEIKQLLEYNQNTGCFLWKSRESSSFAYSSRGNACKTWNSRFAGKRAGCVNRGYLIIRINEINYQAHKLAYIYVYGEAPNDDIDHINRNTKDNRICNLRSVSRSDNLINNPILSNNTSGIRGVSFDKRLKKWHAYIKKNYKRINLGLFEDIKEATLARKTAEKNLGFFCYE